MQDSKRFKHQLAQFGRSLSLLMNRATMYQADHPYFRDALESFFTVAEDLIQQMSPLVFILSRERFFIDEEPLDPRINVARLVNHFKKGGVQSVSFYQGLRKNELRLFMEVFTALHQFPNADSMIKAIEQKGIRNIKLNHVFYQKVTSDDEVVSRDALKKLTPEISLEAERKSKKMFLDALLENVLTEELEKTLSVRSLMANPAGISQSMIENDLAVARAGHGAGGLGPGPETGGHEGSEPGLRPGTGSGQEQASSGGAFGAAGQEGGASGPAAQGPGSSSTASGHPVQGTASQTEAPGAAEPVTGTQGGVPGITVPDNEPQGQAPDPAVYGGGFAGGPVEQTGVPGNAAGPAGVEGVPGPAGAERHGTVLAHQLDLISEEIEKSLLGEGEVDLQDLAMAVFQMKTELIHGIESQKALGIAYENEQAILEKANELTDRVFLQIVRDEYRQGNVSSQRMAQILHRLIPDPNELKRLLPKIKTVLLEAGMPLAEYLQLVKDLGRELQDEGIARLLQESAEQVGMDGDDLIEEIKKDPKQAAELMALAAEIRKGTQDEQALTEVLVEYVERMGADMGRDMASENGLKDEDRLRSVITGVESKLVRHLREMDVQDDVLARIENKLNERLDSIVEGIKLDYIRSTGLGGRTGEVEQLTVLQTLERSVSESDDIADILKDVRRSVNAGLVDDDDFAQIYAEMERRKQLRMEKEANRAMPPGVLNQASLKLFIEKEISKSARYEIPFSALAFSVVRAKFKERRPGKKIPGQELLDRVLYRLAAIVRDTDLVGTPRKNQVVSLLPLTPLGDAKLALKRTMKLLHKEPFELEGIPLEVKFAGIALTFQKGRTPDADAFLEALSADLVEMVTRVRNIHALM